LLINNTLGHSRAMGELLAQNAVATGHLITKILCGILKTDQIPCYLILWTQLGSALFLP
jgi:hypothetical protein